MADPKIKIKGTQEGLSKRGSGKIKVDAGKMERERAIRAFIRKRIQAEVPGEERGVGTRAMKKQARPRIVPLDKLKPASREAVIKAAKRVRKAVRKVK
jgi:hypothetical protein